MIGIRGGVGGNAGPVSLSRCATDWGPAMRKVQLSATTLLILAGFIFTARPVVAVSPQRCDWTPRSVAAAPATEESRVADWIVARILKLAADSGPVIDISPQEVAAATGIDVNRVDSAQVAQKVRERLREMSRQPFVEHQGPTEAQPPTPSAHPLPCPASDPAAAWAPAETTGGVPETHN